MKMVNFKKNGVLTRRSLCGTGLYGAALMLTGCGGGGGDSSPAANNGSSGPINGGLTGKIYYVFTDTVAIVDLATGNFTEISRKVGSTPGQVSFVFDGSYFELSADSKTFYFLDTTFDRTDSLAAVDIASNTVKTVFKLGRADYFTEIRLSPDGQKFALVRNTIFDSIKNGVYVFDTAGKQLTYYQATKDANNSVNWTRDNRLLFTDDGIYLSDPDDLQNATQISPTVASSISLNPAGDKIVYASKGHIWTMSVTGGNVQQVTTGDNAELQPRWSPDGKYIVFQNRVEATVGGSVASVNYLYYLGVIPADGKQYTLKKIGPGGSTVCGVGCSAVTSTGVTGSDGVIFLKAQDPKIGRGSLYDFAADDMIWR
jgi:WD40-like Beta Propeller Repeat